jgi:hypothetical protein
MKTSLIAFFVFFFAIPPAHSQSALEPRTCIRSVIAQGGDLRMLMQLGEAGAYQISIYSDNGQLVYQETLHGHAGEAVKDIAFNGHPHGIYVVSITGASGQSSRDVMW